MNLPEVRVPFGDLRRTYATIRDEVDGALRRVTERGWFILGEEGEHFEREFAAYVGAPFCVGCNSGTDAINLALRAHGCGSGTTAITAANTCVPTVAGIAGSGARIRLCDVEETTALMSHDSLEKVMRSSGAKAVVPVHLYGQPCDIGRLRAVAEEHGAVLIEDAAQAHGAVFNAKRIGGHGNTACWSFYPSKNLGAFGDAGAVTTHSEEVAHKLLMLRNYGQEKRYHHSVAGVNSRLDEMQAAILRVRLPRLDAENARRKEVAERYRREIKSPLVQFMEQQPGAVSCEHLFVVRHQDRDGMLRQLARSGVQALIHYPIPIHLQQAYEEMGYRRGDFPVAERLCGSVLSLPMFPEITDAEVEQVIAAVNAYTV